MCLHSKTRTPLIAETDIVCYKVLQNLESVEPEIEEEVFNNNRLNGVKYLTPYKYFPMELGKTYYCFDEKRELFVFGDCVQVGAGFIHTFSNIKEALNSIAECDMCGAVIVKSIIPKGTEYYEGNMFLLDGDITSYASRVIVLGGEDDIVASTDNTTNKDYKVILNYNGKRYTYKDDALRHYVFECENGGEKLDINF